MNVQKNLFLISGWTSYEISNCGKEKMSFATTYFYEAGFSVLLDLKSKKRNKLVVEDDMRLKCWVIQPNIFITEILFLSLNDSGKKILYNVKSIKHSVNMVQALTYLK